ncbi:MAG: cysteine desulfurase NifS [Candidatus Micrarchaeia archaeon]
MKIYFDHSATTQADSRAVKEMIPYMIQKYGNPSSLHQKGLEAKKALDGARKQIADFINANDEEIIFTSGGTESDNLAIKGVITKEKNHIITSVIEHPAILDTCKRLEMEGIRISYIPVDKNGIINLKKLEKEITKNTAIVSIMHANNEIGTIQPIEGIGKICRKKRVYFHTDAVQTFGKIKIDVSKMNIDLLSASSHKIYGPKGVGLLYIRKGVKINPILNGGGQEFGKRSGTVNVAGIIGFSKAVQLCKKTMEREQNELLEIRNYLIEKISKIKYAKLNGHKTKRLCGNINFCFGGVEGEALVMLLSQKGIYASTGSACSSKSLEPSHVLTAIGLAPEDAHGSLRISLGRGNTLKQAGYLIKILPKIIEKLRRMNPLYEKEN